MKPWQEIAHEIQTYRDSSIDRIVPPIPILPTNLPPNVSIICDQVLPQSENEITNKSAAELLQLLACKHLSSVQVVTAFLRRAGVAQKLTNCVTEVLPERALARAKQLDEILQRTGRIVGPLHGLPISVKEHYSMKGLTCNAGFIAWHDQIMDDNAHVLKILWDAGAVFYVRTTEPQCLMHLETDTNLYGQTLNPYNRDLTSGGSSGGEGALLALRGSCLGIGSDIGGSVRSPAANCGVWSFRPSTYRIPNDGAMAPMLGEEQIVPVTGPLSTSLEGLNLFMKTVIDQKPWLTEPSLLPIPWSYPPTRSSFVKSDGRSRLKVGVMWHDNVVRPHPPITRALKDVISCLEKYPDKFEIVPWTPLRHKESWDILSALYFPDAGRAMKDVVAVSDEPWLPLSQFIIDEQPMVREYKISEVWDLTLKREAYRTDYAAHWKASGSCATDSVDVILCPVGPGAAPPHNCSRYWGYTAVWNLLDYPAMVFPVTRVDEKLDDDGRKNDGYVPMNEQDAWNWKLWTEGGAKRYKDAPISLQLVGRRWQDEQVFEAMDMIKQVTGF